MYVEQHKSNILNLLEETSLDVLLITDGYNIRYLSGFRGMEGALLLSRDSQWLLTDSRYTTQAKLEAPEFTVCETDRSHPVGLFLKEFLTKCGGIKIGFEDRHMLCAVLEEMKEICKGEWCGLGEQINRLRMIKSPEEIRAIETAEEIGDAAFSHILTVLHPGMREIEVAAELDYFMKKQGASGNSFSTIVASGPNSAMPHAIPGSRRLEEGDFVTMDFGCVWEGYCSDMTRTVAVGAVNEKQKEIYQVVLEAQKQALEAIRPGKIGKEIDQIARDVIKEAGYGDYFGHGLGHSVGLFIHESPRLAPTGEEILQPGMLETVEPGIYVPDFCGVRIEDLVVVTEDGCRNLTHSAKELTEI